MRQEWPFAQLYCKQRGIGPGEYSSDLLRQTLYPHARVAMRCIRLISPGFFRIDYDLVHDLARLGPGGDFESRLADFLEHPANRKNLLRSLLLLRVGTRRLRKIVRRVTCGMP